MKIIDGKVRLRTKLFLKPWTTDLKPYFKDYIHWYNMKDRLTPIPVEKQIKQTKSLGIEKMVVSGLNKEENEHILKLAQQYKEIIPVAGVNTNSGIRSALEDIKYYCGKKNDHHR